MGRLELLSADPPFDSFLCRAGRKIDLVKEEEEKRTKKGRKKKKTPIYSRARGSRTESPVPKTAAFADLGHYLVQCIYDIIVMQYF